MIHYLPSQLQHLNWREYPMDGSLLLFERDTGLNVLMEGEEVAHYERIAPRNLLIAVTNICNLTCYFCYRNLKSPSAWTYESLLTFCQQASEWGVLEVAFGGGEPMLFKNWAGFIHELYDTSQLAINFTTNGMMITEGFLRQIEGKYGNIRLSIYEDNEWEYTINRLVNCGARFGINWMITPADLPSVEAKFLKLLNMGVRDFLLLSYKGSDSTLHFSAEDYVTFAAFVNKMHQTFPDIQIKLDVCWGALLPDVPHLFELGDCGAGDGYLSITSDKQIKPCSFHHWSIPFETLDDVRTYWEAKRKSHQAAAIGGCARLPNRALDDRGRLNDETLHLAAVQQ